MKNLKILYLEDSAYDAEIVGRTLKDAGIDFSLKLVDSQNDYENALGKYQPDLILADHSLFEFNSLEALRIFKSYNLQVPFILVTGTVSEEFAVNILKEGADDYLLKDNLARLPKAILNALEKFRIDRERQKYLDNIIANEALLREAEHLARFGSWEADMRSGEVKWSDEIFRIYGYKPGEIVPDYQTFLRHVHPKEREAVKKALEEAVERLDSYEYEFRIVDKTGGVKYINSKLVIDRNSDGVPTRLAGFNQDISERKKAEKNLLRSAKEVTKLERELAARKLEQQKLITEVTIQAQEKEREELGKELHDNINQVLATVKMAMGVALNEEKLREEILQKCFDNVTYVIEEIRKLSKSLVAPSLGDLGLLEALQELIEEINFANKINVELNYENYKEKITDTKKTLMLYRIIQEQLNNIFKYARASKVIITLKSDAKSIFLSIADNGVGFDPSKKAKGIGLKNIAGRVEFFSGNMNIISAPCKGCALEINIPINK